MWSNQYFWIFFFLKFRGDFQQNFKTKLGHNEHRTVRFNHKQNLSHMFFQVKFIRKQLLLENHMLTLTWRGQARPINLWTLQICKADINNKLNAARYNTWARWRGGRLRSRGTRACWFVRKTRSYPLCSLPISFCIWGSPCSFPAEAKPNKRDSAAFCASDPVLQRMGCWHGTWG